MNASVTLRVDVDLRNFSRLYRSLSYFLLMGNAFTISLERLIIVVDKWNSCCEGLKRLKGDLPIYKVNFKCSHSKRMHGIVGSIIHARRACAPRVSKRLRARSQRLFTGILRVYACYTVAMLCSFQCMWIVGSKSRYGKIININIPWIVWLSTHTL